MLPIQMSSHSFFSDSVIDAFVLVIETTLGFCFGDCDKQEERLMRVLGNLDHAMKSETSRSCKDSMFFCCNLLIPIDFFNAPS